jgi:predicted anti-sigma-YlaC factor YlaD
VQLGHSDGRLRLLMAVTMVLALAASGCSIKGMAINTVADTLSGSGDGFARDDDPELIRAAVPFSLKLMESLLEEVPRHRGLLLTACSGFTQYAYAFVQVDAELVEHDDFAEYRALLDRARNMYLRGRDYCLRGLEVRYPGMGQRLTTDPDEAVRRVRPDDVEYLYWTAASWGAAIAISLDRPALVADLPAVQALIRRALTLDEAHGEGALHAFMINLEALPAAMGGSPDRARHHFARAVELSKGRAAGPYVTFARSVAAAEQDRPAFVQLLEAALAIDAQREPSLRLPNLIAQRQARHLLEHVDLLFLPDEEH